MDCLWRMRLLDYPGAGDRNWWFNGLVIQRQVVKTSLQALKSFMEPSSKSEAHLC